MPHGFSMSSRACRIAIRRSASSTRVACPRAWPRMPKNFDETYTAIGGLVSDRAAER